MLHGFIHPSYHPLARALERQLSATPGGAAVCVYHQGECVADLWGGTRDEAGNPWRADTMSVSFSTTKGVATTALHMVVDRGLLDYDEPVATYWPEFAQAGKHRITVADVLRHQAGLHNVRQLVDRAERMMDWGYMVDALASAAPAEGPANATGYHALTYGYLVGELIRRATGKTFPEFVESEIARPLSLDGLYVGAPEQELHRAARLVGKPIPGSGPKKARHGSDGRTGRGRGKGGPRGPLGALARTEGAQRLRGALAPRGIARIDFSSPEALGASMPSANGLFTARSLARMYAALAGGGTLDGVQLMSPETLLRAGRRQKVGRDRVLPFPMGWRLGYHNVMTTAGVPRRAFGHYGYGGSGGWACPTRNLAFAMVLNGDVNSPWAGFRTLRISAAALRCASRYARVEGHVAGEAPRRFSLRSRAQRLSQSPARPPACQRSLG